MFLVVAGHNDSEGLSDTEPFSHSLRGIFSSQPAIKELAIRGQLISVAYTYNPAELKFNSEQSKLIGAWLQNKIQCTRM